MKTKPGYVYIRSEPRLWTVGHYDMAGTWQPESDHGTAHDAATRVHWLNGGCAPQCHAHPRLRAFAEEYRQLKLKDGLTHSEIADRMGIKRGSVERNVARARLLNLLPPYDPGVTHAAVVRERRLAGA